jgi:hypothetical protein
MWVKVRAFNKDGYHKDILIVSEKQVHQHDTRIREPLGSITSGLLGPGGSIDPKDFPEMIRFEVVVETE